MRRHMQAIALVLAVISIGSPAFAQRPTSMGTISADVVKATQDQCQWTSVSSGRWASPWSRECEDAVTAYYQQQNSPRTQPSGTSAAGTPQPAQAIAAPARPTGQGSAVSNPKPESHSAHAKGTVATAGVRNQSRTAAPGPVFELDLPTSLAQGKSSQALAAEVTERGIDFYFDDGDIEYLRLLGATDELLNGLHHARYVFVDYQASPAKWKAEAARDEADARGVEAKRPDDAVIHWLLGMTLEFEQKPADAVPEFRKAIALKPDMACAHQNLAETLLASGDQQNALPEAREAVRLTPNAVDTHLVLGWVLNQTGDLVGAIAELREAARVAPDYYASHYSLGSVLFNQKNTDEAIHELREAVQLNPNYGRCHYGLGQALYEKQDFDGAAFEFKEAVRLNPGNATLHTWLAAALFRAGQPEEAAAEARTALMYEPKDTNAKQFLTSARAKLGETAGPVEASAPQQTTQNTQTASSGGLGGTTWSCHEVQTNAATLNYSITFLDTGIVKKDGGNWGQLGEPDATWQLSGSHITLRTPDSTARMVYEGDTDTSNSITARIVALYQDQGDFGSLDCRRQTPMPLAQPIAPSSQSTSRISSHPPYDDTCIRLGPGTLGAVAFTNICTEPIDLKWCYRQHAASGDWHCTVTPKLLPNHTLASPSCYQCSYDGRAAAYLSSRNLLASLPSDEEVASWSGSGPPQSASNNSSNSGSSDGQRQWRFVNPSQNWDTLTFEIRGRNGDSNSDDWNDETPLQTVTLKPGESWTEDCGGYFSLDIKWVLASSSDPQTDVYYASQVCYANNFEWNNNHNLREYDFPRQ